MGGKEVLSFMMWVLLISNIILTKPIVFSWIGVGGGISVGGGIKSLGGGFDMIWIGVDWK